MRKLFCLVFLTAVLSTWIAAMASGSDFEGRHCRREANLERIRSRACYKLTEEQCEAIQKRIRQMRSEGASRDDIISTVREMLHSFGVEKPKHAYHQRRYIMSQLSDEQRQAVRQKINQMREAGATREQIRTQVMEMIKEFGIEIPLSSKAPSENRSQRATWGSIKSQYR